MSIPSNVGGYELPDWAFKTIAGTLTVFGLTVALFGFRLFKITLFTVGFFVGSLAIGVPIAQKVNSPAAPWIGVGVGSFVGLILGLTAALFAKLGVFLVGAGGGIAVGIALNTVVGYRIPINHDVTMGLLAAGGGLVFGILALILRRPLIIIGTAILGSFSATFGIGNLIPSPNDLGNILDIANAVANNSGNLPTKDYGYLGGFAVASLLSIFFQASFTAGKAPKKGEKDQWAALTEDELNGKWGSSGDSSSSKGKKDKKDKKKDKKDKDGGKKEGASAGSSSGGKLKASERLRAALLNDYSASSPGVGNAGGNNSSSRPGPPLPPAFNPNAEHLAPTPSASASASIWARSSSMASSQASSAAPNPFRSGGSNDLFSGRNSSPGNGNHAGGLYPGLNNGVHGSSYDDNNGAVIQISSYGANGSGSGIAGSSFAGDAGFYGTSPAVGGGGGGGGNGHPGGIPETNPFLSYSPSAPPSGNAAGAAAGNVADWRGGGAQQQQQQQQQQGKKKGGWFGR